MEITAHSSVILRFGLQTLTHLGIMELEVFSQTVTAASSGAVASENFKSCNSKFTSKQRTRELLRDESQQMNPLTMMRPVVIGQTDTPTLPSICMKSFTAAQQIVAELLQHEDKLKSSQTKRKYNLWERDEGVIPAVLQTELLTLLHS
ncbi:hypothetical protein FQN60_005092 [Etheostoma spectabile]|uniref:Uncharacterized protein n=1 Tax=Etheostoma spectabile TaxID=54343 RepID=A0A5J5DM34_9PERO|nr:hypothetical protein FQN60_005092 [Etheostoma spectabile]